MTTITVENIAKMFARHQLAPSVLRQELVITDEMLADPESIVFQSLYAILSDDETRAHEECDIEELASEFRRSPVARQAVSEIQSLRNEVKLLKRVMRLAKIQSGEASPQ